MTIDEAIKQTENVVVLLRSERLSILRGNSDYWQTILPILRSKQIEEKNEPCNFCQTFDFGDASASVDKYGARIKLAGGRYKYQPDEQFNFCPVCGRRLTHD